jgi:hypothetical protein
MGQRWFCGQRDLLTVKAMILVLFVDGVKVGEARMSWPWCQLMFV